jgi:hypothetical protein
LAAIVTYGSTKLSALNRMSRYPFNMSLIFPFGGFGGTTLTYPGTISFLFKPASVFLLYIKKKNL